MVTSADTSNVSDEVTMIAISGASGHLGRKTLQALSKRAPMDRIVAIVRDVEKAQDLQQMGYVVRQGNYDDEASMRAALRGVEKFLLISSSSFPGPHRVQQHQKAVAAAAEVGVSLLAYTSLLHCDTAQSILARDHRATEAAIRAAAIPFVILRNGWYLENYSDNLAPVLQSGTLLGSAAQGKVSAASRADFAAAAAVVLTEPGHMNKVYELAGDEHFTLEGLAQAISRHSGKVVHYKQLPEHDFAAILKQHHVPAPIADMLANSDVGISRGELHNDSHALSQLLGRPTRSLDSLLKDLLPR